MIEVAIPGDKILTLNHLVMDYNGTMACDGACYPMLDSLLSQLIDKIDIHVITADTFGQVKAELSNFAFKNKINISILSKAHQERQKLEFVQKLGPEVSVCIGNGKNDRLMLKKAALGIALIQEEGAHIESILSADIVCKDITSALGLLINTKRLIATLRT